MFGYRKRLFYPVHIECTDQEVAVALVEHYGGKDSELSAALQYLNHRSNITNRYISELLGLIAAEELSHLEVIAAIINKIGLPLNYVNSKELAWTLRFIDQSADLIQMLEADIESETRSKALYGRHLGMVSDPGLKKILLFLRKREEVHKSLLQRALSLVKQGGSQEQFSKLIYDYRMSLQVLE
ncbi:MAG: manganese catalase family protein [Desulfitobacterium hafniense]|nr:manganese catalase family protein [Desulfitobacterium hafniense]